jgi:hypothetical protein
LVDCKWSTSLSVISSPTGASRESPSYRSVVRTFISYRMRRKSSSAGFSLWVGKYASTRSKGRPFATVSLTDIWNYFGSSWRIKLKLTTNTILLRRCSRTTQRSYALWTFIVS